eukprot:COSAG02_NODE_24226_length_694_cov_1.206723_1_plen_166_part_00
MCWSSNGRPPGSSMSLPWAICHRLSSRCWSCACAAACQQVRTRSLPSLAAHLPSEQQIAAAQQRWWGADYPRISRQFMVAAPLRVLESFSSVLGRAGLGGAGCPKITVCLWQGLAILRRTGSRGGANRDAPKDHLSATPRAATTAATLWPQRSRPEQGLRRAPPH